MAKVWGRSRKKARAAFIVDSLLYLCRSDPNPATLALPAGVTIPSIVKIRTGHSTRVVRVVRTAKFITIVVYFFQASSENGGHHKVPSTRASFAIASAGTVMDRTQLYSQAIIFRMHRNSPRPIHGRRARWVPGIIILERDLAGICCIAR